MFGGCCAVTIPYITIIKSMASAGTISMGTSQVTNDEAAEIQQHSIMKVQNNVLYLLKTLFHLIGDIESNLRSVFSHIHLRRVKLHYTLTHQSTSVTSKTTRSP